MNTKQAYFVTCVSIRRRRIRRSEWV